jgi:hypothetical protein
MNRLIFVSSRLLAPGLVFGQGGLDPSEILKFWPINGPHTPATIPVSATAPSNKSTSPP